MPNKASQKISDIKEVILHNFVCQQCAGCCKISDGYVYITLPEMIKVADFLKLNMPDFMAKYILKEDGHFLLSSPRHHQQCFLDQHNRCQIYAVRPAACATYPDWPYLWRSFDAFLEEVNSCPGLAIAFEKIRKE
jgi:Fe-S-cluster containining protein